MADIESVYSGLDKCRKCDCDDCTLLNASKAPWDCPAKDKLIDDALELLKEQEAVTIKKTKEHGFGVYGGICPKCRNWIQSAHSFCGFCGQAVKWE